MLTMASILLVSFALILPAQSVVGRGPIFVPKIRTQVKTDSGPGPVADVIGQITSSVGGDKNSPDQIKKTSAAISSAVGEDISSDQLKKIGSEVKEAYKNIENNVHAEISPEQEEKLIEEFAKDLAPSPGDSDGPSSEDGEESEDGGDAPSPGGDGGASSPAERAAPNRALRLL